MYGELDRVNTLALQNTFGLSSELMKTIANRLFWQLYAMVKDERIIEKKILFFKLSVRWSDLYDTFVRFFGPPPLHP